MGYTTNYELTVQGAELLAVHEFLKTATDYEFSRGRSPRVLYASGDTMFDADAVMVRVAEQFPDAAFCLRAFGEDGGYIWRAFYKHSFSPLRQRARIVFDFPPDWAWEVCVGRPLAEAVDYGEDP